MKLTKAQLTKLKRTENAVMACLTDDLRYDQFKDGHPLAGFCYIVAEAMYHMIGKQLRLKPMFVRVSGVPHWFLEKPADGMSRRITLDPTIKQFWDDPECDTFWFKARGKGFLTKQPSKRAQELMRRAQEVLKEKT